jgi:hypothetical protein
VVQINEALLSLNGRGKVRVKTSANPEIPLISIFSRKGRRRKKKGEKRIWL